jgi:hypothetical protein
MSENWQDISTAPKDGTIIFVWADDYQWPEAVFYEKYDDETAAEVGEPGYWRFAEGILADNATVEFGTLTHWMPLPSPPRDGGR